MFQISIKKNHPTIMFAAEELKKYLEMMHDSSVKIVSEDGQIALEVQKDLTNFGLSKVKDPTLDDQIFIDVEKGSGRIIANNERALLIAVYRYLNSLGVRFLGPNDERVPSKDYRGETIKLKEEPVVRHRGVCIEGATSIDHILSFVDWLPKVGFNSFFVQFENPYPFLKRWYEHRFNPYYAEEEFSIEIADEMSDRVDEAMSIRGLLHHRVGHGWTSEVLGYSSRYGWDDGLELEDESLRPLIAKVDGKREFFNTAPLLTELCMSNETAVEKMTDEIVAYAKNRKDVDYLHVWLSDAHNNICECEECSKSLVSDLYVDMLNRLDEKLSEAKLDTKIAFLLYHELLWPPIAAELKNPERFVLMFAPISRTFEKPYKDHDTIPEIPSYVRNEIELPTNLEENLSFLKGWQEKFSGDSFVYDYPLGRGHYGDFGYVSIAKLIYNDVRYLNKLSLNGYISVQQLRSGFPNYFPNYVMGQALWNKNLDFETIRDDFYRHLYGNFSKEVFNYLEEVSELSSPDYFNGKGERVNEERAKAYDKIAKLAETFMERIYQMQLEEEDSFVKNNLRVLAHHAYYTHMMSKGLSLQAFGKQEEGQSVWEDLLHYIRLNEPNIDRYLDVYRIIEVTKNYAGFDIEPGSPRV